MKLNLGSGKGHHAGYINVDIQEPCDFRWDLTDFPFPWQDNSIDDILMLHCLEHIPVDKFASFMHEIHRILKPGGHFHGQVPFWNHSAHYFHWQHYQGFHWTKFVMIAEHFDFECVQAVPAWGNENWKRRLRNLWPFKRWFCEIMCGMVDYVNFSLKKPI